MFKNLFNPGDILAADVLFYRILYGAQNTHLELSFNTQPRHETLSVEKIT